MGQRTQATIEAWQKAAGIEPATSALRTLLDEMSQNAVELIKVIELERSGIRDGDGMWHGSYPFHRLVSELSELSNKYAAQPGKSTVKPAPKIDVDDYWGGCPQCGKNDGYFNNHRAHYFYCDQHRTLWSVGSNLFSSWRHEDETVWAANREKYANYREVEPLECNAEWLAKLNEKRDDEIPW